MATRSVDAETIFAQHRDILIPPTSRFDSLLDPARRRFMNQAGALGLGLAGASVLGACRSGDGSAVAPTPTPTPAPLGDADILTFALNLEYLEAEYYNIGAFGTGLDASQTTGSGTPGTVTGGRKVAFASDNVRQYIREIAFDEKTHVNFLRTTLAAAGVQPIARPAIDIQNSFTALFRSAGLIGATETFDPYASENNFLLGAFVFNDVGVSAYKGAASLLANKAYLEASAGILAAKAYHAALVRIVLYTRGYDPKNPNYGGQMLLDQVTGISNARDAVDGASDDDQDVTQMAVDPTGTGSSTTYATSNVVPTDANGIAYGRTAGEVLNVTFLNTAGGAKTAGGFFPNGVNGASPPTRAPVPTSPARPTSTPPPASWRSRPTTRASSARRSTPSARPTTCRS